MKERTGGSTTVKDGRIIERVDPTRDHPEGNRARDKDGRPLDALSRKVAATTAAEVQREDPRDE